ncbi:MAG TPA: hypothetical protein VK737_08090 [Opitutales bacterium]|jgi:hypothetical protein|nr:hypothetical protein [Opitutales bacterium]
MKAKEEIPSKCALLGGIAGLFIGVAEAVWTWQQNGAGFLTFAEAALQVLLWTFSCAVIAGLGAFLVVWLTGRKSKTTGLAVTGPDAVLEKSSYLRGLQAETQKCYQGIGSRVTSAEAHLADAEKEFKEGAFAPFWDAIERAANDLAAYKNEVEYLQRNVSTYHTEAAELTRLAGDSVAPLALPQYQLPDARPSAARFMTIVRQAQTNFQFAMIFEQRKTNQLLHTGFGNLGAAIHSLGESINASLDKLARSMDMNTDRMLSYQDPLRFTLSKMGSGGKKPSPIEPPAPRLPQFDNTLE